MNKELLEEINKGNISKVALFTQDESPILYTEKYVKEKDKEIERLKNINEEHRILNGKLREENNRLNNIINELESYLEKTIIDGGTRGSMTFWYRQIYDYLQELKGSNGPSFEEMVGFVENVCKDIKSQPTLHEELEEERKTIAKIVGDFKEVNK